MESTVNSEIRTGINEYTISAIKFYNLKDILTSINDAINEGTVIISLSPKITLINALRMRIISY